MVKTLRNERDIKAARKANLQLVVRVWRPRPHAGWDIGNITEKQFYWAKIESLRFSGNGRKKSAMKIMLTGGRELHNRSFEIGVIER